MKKVGQICLGVALLVWVGILHWWFDLLPIKPIIELIQYLL